MSSFTTLASRGQRAQYLFAYAKNLEPRISAVNSSAIPVRSRALAQLSWRYWIKLLLVIDSSGNLSMSSLWTLSIGQCLDWNLQRCAKLETLRLEKFIFVQLQFFMRCQRNRADWKSNSHSIYASFLSFQDYNDPCPYSLSPVTIKSQKLLRSPRKATRKISRIPFKVLDAPELQDDFYLNLVDWSAQNVLAVGLGSCVYLWSACTSQVSSWADNLGPHHLPTATLET